MSDAPKSIEDLPLVIFSADGSGWTIPVGGRGAKSVQPPFWAEVRDNHDGDSLKIHVPDWPPIIEDVLLRVFGVDTPEMTDPREELRKLSREAKAFTKDRCAKVKNRIRVHDACGDKYFRILGAVELPKIGMLADLLIEAGLGRPYFGVNPKPWDRGL